MLFFWKEPNNGSTLYELNLSSSASAFHFTANGAETAIVPVYKPVPSSPYIEFTTIDPSTNSPCKCVVFSGIAIPEWHLNDDNDVHRQTYTVPLGYPALNVTQATVSLGLASIYNGGSSFLFASDAATLCIDGDTQELNLQVDLALMGDPANLSRFGYQVVATILPPHTGISGTISFPTGMFASTVAELNGSFVISVNTFVEDPGGGGFGQGHWNPVAYGSVTAISDQDGTTVAIYNIPAAPYNLSLAALVGMKDTTAPDPGIVQTSGPNPVLLTPQVPYVDGVDFAYSVNRIK